MGSEKAVPKPRLLRAFRCQGSCFPSLGIVSFVWFVCFEAGSCYVAQLGLELKLWNPTLAY
jgi:hypothetical protein